MWRKLAYARQVLNCLAEKTAVMGAVALGAAGAAGVHVMRQGAKNGRSLRAGFNPPGVQ